MTDVEEKKVEIPEEKKEPAEEAKTHDVDYGDPE